VYVCVSGEMNTQHVTHSVISIWINILVQLQGYDDNFPQANY